MPTLYGGLLECGRLANQGGPRFLPITKTGVDYGGTTNIGLDGGWGKVRLRNYWYYCCIPPPVGPQVWVRR